MESMMLGLLVVLATFIIAVMIQGYVDFRRQWFAKSRGNRAPPSFWKYLKIQWLVVTMQGKPQKGGANVGGIMMLGIAMVFLAIGFIFLPISTTATQSLLDYAYSGNAAITDASYTGFTSVVGITPLLILVGFLCAAVVTGMLGVKVMKGTASASFNPGSLMLLGLSIIFIAVGLIIEPVMLDGVSSVYHGGGFGISADFTGYESILLVAPLLVHIAFLAAAVLSGFFGIKNIARA